MKALLNKGNIVCKLVPTVLKEDGEKNFFGLFYDGKTPVINYPEYYKFKASSDSFLDYRKEIMMILDSIKLGNKKSDKDELEDIFYKGDNGSSLINSYLWIIKDYLTNGFYYDTEKIYKPNSSGRINYPKTFKNMPLISKRNFVFKEIIHESKTSRNDILTDIYKYCLQLSIDRIGVFFGFVKEIKITKQIENHKEQCLAILKNKLANTFDDKKKCRITHMINIIGQEAKNIKGNNFVFGVTSYAPIFEAMVDRLLSNIKKEDKKEYNPSSIYNFNNSTSLKVSEIQPDTICLKDDSIFILDSKYYKADSWPQMSSITKQIIYGRYNKLKFNKKVFNIFVMPSNFEIEENKHFIYKGCVKYDIENLPIIEDYENIKLICIDFNYLINNYNKQNDTIRNNLIDEIADILNENI